jgi:SRSO17 transposase
VEFVTKPRQAQAMISQAIAAGVPFAWFAADETYGQAKCLQAWLEGEDVSYVMAIRCSDTFTMPAGEQRADVLIAAVPSRAWQRICTGAGAHGPREFDWARIPVQTGWRREECFQQAKGEAGLDHYQVRSWRAWYARITLSMLALAWLAASRAQAVKGGRHRRPGHDRLHAPGDPQAPGQLDPAARTGP